MPGPCAPGVAGMAASTTLTNTGPTRHKPLITAQHSTGARLLGYRVTVGADPRDELLATGVSLALARSRSACVAAVSYEVSLRVPSDGGSSVEGLASVAFRLAVKQDVIFD